jgi:hypothetical protein
MRFTTTVGMLLLSRSKWLNVDGVASVHKRVSLTRVRGGVVSCFKELVDKAAPSSAGPLASIRDPSFLVRRKQSKDPFLPTPIPILSRN